MDKAEAAHRYCRCGTRLARDNHDGLCRPCQRRARDLTTGAPDMPPDFWTISDQLHDALSSWHMGRVIAAYRTHPHHDTTLSQETVANWMGITQTQLSRIESGPPLTDLAKLIRWTQILRIPEAFLWFKVPGLPPTANHPALTNPPHLPARRDARPSAGLIPEPVRDKQPSLFNTVRDLHLPEETIAALLEEPWSEPSAFPTDDRSPRDESAHDDLMRLLQAWATTVKRRQFLLSMGRAATAAATIPLLAGTEVEPDRVRSALDRPARVDATLISHIEEVLRHALSQDAVLGPQAAIQTVLDQRHLARHLLEDCPPDLRPRLLSVYAGLCRATGWFIFDLGHFDAAVPHFEEGRTAAHEARNTELDALILCNLAQTAIWHNRPRLAVDHASAAVAWSWRTPDRALQANTGDMAARAFAAAGDYDAAMQELHRAETALAAADRAPSLVDWYDEAFLTGIRGQCLLALGRPAEAISIITPSLAAMDPTVSIRNLAMTTVDLGTAYIQQGEVEEGARTLGRASELAARNRSVRLATGLRTARGQLEPWKNTPAVSELDEKMASLWVLQGEPLLRSSPTLQIPGAK
ncbi:hypothetical protein [Frankia sp. Cas3]|uniref:helix-turn-helix domain-containing protein n=1 Tax=Frankia sp. Cas3 TaxID=3073926 RepID=UPI002AD2AF7F|nr:hypothetical protein [Frankia sp. Cas3]